MGDVAGVMCHCHCVFLPLVCVRAQLVPVLVLLSPRSYLSPPRVYASQPAADAPPEAPDTPIVATPAPTYEEPRELNMESMEEDTAAFQKDAIWRELQVYKKRVARAEHDDKDKTARQRDYEKAFAAVNNVWAQVSYVRLVACNESRIL